ncbi:MAG: kynureninase [Steroidobacteraceae bacterium]
MPPRTTVPPQRSFERQLEWARAQDEADPLAGLRACFALPRATSGAPLLYLCGHSLGLAPIAARAMIEAQVTDWEHLGVLGHEHAHSPWIEAAESLREPLAQLAGALPAEVIAMNSLTVNLHLLLASFYRPAAGRSAILIESGAFSSDRHAVATQIAWHGLDPARELIEVRPAPGEDLVSVEAIESAIARHGERLALVLWPGVQYRTGQCFDLARVARAAHAAGSLAGFDLAHAIGNVPLSLHADAADFAVWCSYKYLNAGPGAIGGAFVHERHFAAGPRLAGWWGHAPSTRFALRAEFTPAGGAAGYAISNPPIFSCAPLRASLPLFDAAGFSALRAKSMALTGYLEALVTEIAPEQIAVVTPADPAQRGCQLSLRMRRGGGYGRRAFEALAAQGVIGDWREPDIIRLAPVPLYNRYEDVLRAAWQLGALLTAA